jgi:hypothetical protein
VGKTASDDKTAWSGGKCLEGVAQDQTIDLSFNPSEAAISWGGQI